MNTREHPMPGQVLMTVDGLDGDYDTDTHVETRLVVTDLDQAHVVTSRVASASTSAPAPIVIRGLVQEMAEVLHKPVLDIDFPVKAVPSSTPGHFHLYLDKALTWEQYDRLLTVMAEIGLLEPGYVSASRERKHTTVRLPWVRKTAVAPQSEG